MIQRIFVLLLLLVASTAAFGEIRIITANKSYHYDRPPQGEPRYNENHKGVGFEVKISKHNWFGYLQFQNSFYQDSRMIKFNHERPLGNDWHWGLMLGIADGYDERKPGFKKHWCPNGVPAQHCRCYERVCKEASQGFFGATIRYKFIRVLVTPVVAVAGFVFEFK